MWLLTARGLVKKATLAVWGSEAVAPLLQPGETLTVLAFALEAFHPRLEDDQRDINRIFPRMAYIALTSERLLVLRGSVTNGRPAGLALEAATREVRIRDRKQGWLFERLVIDMAGQEVFVKVRRDWWAEFGAAITPLADRV